MAGPEPRSTSSLERRVRQHVNARPHDFFAVVQPGFEETAREELAEIGIAPPLDIAEGGVEFSARLEGCYRVNLCARTVTRVLMRVARFRAENFKGLERHVMEIPWELYIFRDTPMHFSVSCRHSRLYHSGAVEERVRRGIAGRLSRFGAMPESIFENSTEAVGQTVFVRLKDDGCTLSVDATGEPLYRRGYRTHITEAPLRETLAASILREAKLVKYDILLDPMGGSGTFSLEGAMLFQRRLPGLRRSFAFTVWPAFRGAAFNHLVKGLFDEEQSGVPPVKTVIYRDIDPAAVETSMSNAVRAGLDDYIRIGQGDFLAGPVTLPAGRTFIALNPPWGARMGGPDETRRLYRRIGETIRKHYRDCGYAVIVPGLELEKVLSLPYDRKFLFMSGGIKVGLVIKDGF